jgi:hypothetical protein
MGFTRRTSRDLGKAEGMVMSSGQRVKKHPFNPTQIKNGRIVRLRKDGTVKADLGPYKGKQIKAK